MLNQFQMVSESIINDKLQKSEVLFNAVETMLFEFRLILNDPDIPESEKAAVMECLEMLISTMGVATKYINYQLRSVILENELKNLGYTVDYQTNIDHVVRQ